MRNLIRFICSLTFIVLATAICYLSISISNMFIPTRPVNLALTLMLGFVFHFYISKFSVTEVRQYISVKIISISYLVTIFIFSALAALTCVLMLRNGTFNSAQIISTIMPFIYAAIYFGVAALALAIGKSYISKTAS